MEKTGLAAQARDEQLIDLILTLLIGFGTFLIVVAFLSAA